MSSKVIWTIPEKQHSFQEDLLVASDTVSLRFTPQRTHKGSHNRGHPYYVAFARWRRTLAFSFGRRTSHTEFSAYCFRDKREAPKLPSVHNQYTESLFFSTNSIWLDLELAILPISTSFEGKWNEKARQRKR